MKYRVGRNGREIGSWTLEELVSLHQRGELLGTDFVWCPGMPAWKTLAEILPASTPQPDAPVSPALPDLPALPDVAPLPGSPSAAPASAGTSPLHAPGAPRHATTPPPPKPSNNLIWAVLVTFFCCQILGIVAIVFAAQVDSKYNAGDYEGAASMARQAKIWCWVAFGCGLVVTTVAMFFVFFSAMMDRGGFGHF